MEIYSTPSPGGTAGQPQGPVKLRHSLGRVRRPILFEDLTREIFPGTSKEWVQAAKTDQPEHNSNRPPQSIIVDRGAGTSLALKSLVSGGSFGQIFMYTRGDARVALKIMRSDSKCLDTEDLFRSNSAIGRSFSQYLLYQKCIEFAGNDHTTVLMEMCMGDLNYLLPILENDDNALKSLRQYGMDTWSLKLDILLKTLGAVFCLYERGYSYLDLKAANVLYNIEACKTGSAPYCIVPKLADLDGVCSVESAITTFPPPEMWQGENGMCDDKKLSWAVVLFVVQIMLLEKGRKLVTMGLWHKNVVGKGKDAVKLTDEIKMVLQGELKGFDPGDLDELKGGLDPNPKTRTKIEVITRAILKYYESRRRPTPP